MIEFRLDPRSGVATYLQLTRQVRHAVRLGILHAGDQLPTAREVVGRLAINPNTVHKAYRELEREGLVEARPGLGTFIADDVSSRPMPQLESLRRSLRRWLGVAREAGLDDDDIDALITSARRDLSAEDVA